MYNYSIIMMHEIQPATLTIIITLIRLFPCYIDYRSDKKNDFERIQMVLRVLEPKISQNSLASKEKKAKKKNTKNK